MSHIQTATQPEDHSMTHTRLEDAMGMLSAISRRVIELWLEGRSKAQIAAETGLGEEEVSEIGLEAIQQVRASLASWDTERNQGFPADSHS